MATMPSICFLVILLGVPQAGGQGFLRSSTETKDAIPATNTSQDVHLEADGITLAGVDDIDVADSEVRSDMKEEAADLRETRQEMKQTGEWLKGEDASTDDDQDDSKKDMDQLESENSDQLGSSDEQDEQDQDDSKKDVDQLQSEVNVLQDEMPRQGDKPQSIESDEEELDDGHGEDDGNRLETALLQDDDDGNNLPDDSIGSDEDTQSTDQPDLDLDASLNANDGQVANDTALLQNMVHELVSEALKAQERQKPFDSDRDRTENTLPSKPESNEAPELITVLIQTMKKHASIFGGKHSRNLGKGSMSDEDDTDGDETMDDSSEDVASEESDDMGESFEDYLEDSEDEPSDESDDEGAEADEATQDESESFDESEA